MNQLLDGQPQAPPRFTEKQGQYLAFIWTYGLVNGRSPAERDMQRFFGVTAPSVHQMVLTLERAGLIRKQPGLARSIELLIEPDSLPRLQPIETVKSSVQRYQGGARSEATRADPRIHAVTCERCDGAEF